MSRCSICGCNDCCGADYEKEIEKLQAENARLREGLEEIKNYDNNDHLDVVGIELQDIARQILKEIDK